MNLNKYQEWTRSTAIYPKDRALEYLSLGLVSEAGEVAGKMKKAIRDNTFDLDAFVSEVGDCFWYLARICDELDINAELVIEGNMKKLEDRKARNVLSGSGDAR